MWDVYTSWFPQGDKKQKGGKPQSAKEVFLMLSKHAGYYTSVKPITLLPWMKLRGEEKGSLLLSIFHIECCVLKFYSFQKNGKTLRNQISYNCDFSVWSQTSTLPGLHSKIKYSLDVLFYYKCRCGLNVKAVSFFISKTHAWK